MKPLISALGVVAAGNFPNSFRLSHVSRQELHLGQRNHPREINPKINPYHITKTRIQHPS